MKKDIKEEFLEEKKEPVKRNKIRLEFFGRVKTKEMIKQPSGRFVGQIRYDLIVEIYDDPTIKKIQVMKEKVSDEIWEAVINSKYYGRNWIFYCYKLGERYRLTDWQADSEIEEEEEEHEKK